MQFIFTLLNISLSASWLVIAVILIRCLLKNAPRWIFCLLWGIVALRLLLPFMPESNLSLIPSAQLFPQDIATAHTPAIQSGIPSVNGALNPLLAQLSAQKSDWPEKAASIAFIIWAVGAGIVLLCSIFSYWKLRRLVGAAIRYQGNIYICDNVPSPFLLGLFVPKIYIPSDIAAETLPYILAHEKAHIRRGDHLWKPLGFLLLSVHWYNPLLWVAYILLCRDIEQACDERVIASMDNQYRKHYSEALLSCSLHRKLIMTCPVAFGSVSVKNRIKKIVQYKKPSFWILLASIAACLVAAVCFLTNPKPCEHIYASEMTVISTCTDMGVETFTCTLCKYQYTAPVEKLEHNYGCTVLTAPSCIVYGVKEFTCADCGHTTTEQMEKTDHTPGELFVTKAPTCIQTGEESSVCTLCQVTFVTQTLPTNDVHDFTQTVVRESTCAEAGEGKNTCSRCGYEESCALEKLSHNYRVGMVSPGCPNSTGSKQMICNDCGNEQWYDTGYGTEHQYSGSLYSSICNWCNSPNPNSPSPYQTSASLTDSVTYTSKNNSYLDQNPVFPDPTPELPKPASTSLPTTTQTVTTNFPVIQIWP